MTPLTILLLIMIVALVFSTGYLFRISSWKTTKIESLEIELSFEETDNKELREKIKLKSTVQVLLQTMQDKTSEALENMKNSFINEPFVDSLMKDRRNQIKLLTGTKIRVDDEETYNMIVSELKSLNYKIKLGWKGACWIFITELVWVIADLSNLLIGGELASVTTEIKFNKQSLQFYFADIPEQLKSAQEKMAEDYLENDEPFAIKGDFIGSMDLALRGDDRTVFSEIERNEAGEITRVTQITDGELLKTNDGKGYYKPKVEETKIGKSRSLIVEKYKQIQPIKQNVFVLGKRIEIESEEHLISILAIFNRLGYKLPETVGTILDKIKWLFVPISPDNKELCPTGDKFSWEMGRQKIMKFDTFTNMFVEVPEEKEKVVNSTKILTQRQIISNSKIIVGKHSKEIQEELQKIGAKWSGIMEPYVLQEQHDDVLALYCRERDDVLVITKSVQVWKHGIKGFCAGTTELTEIYYNPVTELFDLVDEETNKSQVDIDREEMELVSDSRVSVKVGQSREILQNLFSKGAVWESDGTRGFNIDFGFLFIENKGGLKLTMKGLSDWNESELREIKFNYKTNHFEALKA